MSYHKTKSTNATINGTLHNIAHTEYEALDIVEVMALPSDARPKKVGELCIDHNVMSAAICIEGGRNYIIDYEEDGEVNIFKAARLIVEKAEEN